MQPPDIQKAGFGNAAHSPGKSQCRGSDSKADHVGQRVKLLAKFATRMGGSGHKPVKQIKEDCEPDGVGRVVQVRTAALKRGHYGVEAAKHVRHGQRTGQKVNAPSKPEVASPDAGKSKFMLFEIAHFHRARVLVPPATCWPGRTTISTPSGSQISMREPKRIIPTRSPRIRESPGDFQQTIRRATHPAICLKTTSPRSLCT